MGLFSKKGKGKTAAAAAAASDKPAEDKPQPAPYKHVPKHAAIDSLGQGGRSQNNQQIALASQHRLSNAAFDSTLGNASYRQSMALSMYHGMPSPGMPSPAGSYTSSSRRSSMNQRFPGGEVFVTDPDAPPMPISSPQIQKHNSALRRNAGSRAEGDYFSHPGMTKTMLAEQEQEYIHANHSSDSGYGSAGTTAIHSRVASEKNLAENHSKHFLPEANEGLLPDFNLTEELLNEPAFSEHSFTEDKPLEMLPSARTKEARTASSLSQRQPSTDRHVNKPPKAASSVKKTRFEEPSEVQQPVAPSQHTRGRSSLSSDPATLAALQGQPSPVQQPSYSHVVPVPQHFDFFSNDRPITPPSEDEVAHMQTLTRRSSSQSAGQGPQSQILRSNLPPLALLEGFKVNKRGKILDEEGEPIGELVEGDIMDCVRQRVNAYGEVLDEFGGVVGIVRTIQRGSESARVRDASPPPFRHSPHHSDVTSPVHPSIGSQPSAFEHNRFPSDATLERGRSTGLLQNHQFAVPPLDNQDESRIELDATGNSEAAPIIDHSEIFSPPFIPSRSTRRPSPSSSVDGQDAGEAKQPSAAANEKSRVMMRDSGIGSFENHHQKAHVAQGVQIAQEQSRRPVRNHSDRSLSDLAKSYARPSMNSVPENNVPDEDSQIKNPGLFSYKGEIPLKDGPQQAVRPVRQPTGFVNGVANLSMRPSQFAGPGMAVPRRVTTQSMSALPPMRPGLSPRHSLNYPARRSPLASHEATPNDSDAGTDNSNSDDGKYQYASGVQSGVHSRSASIRTTNTTTSTMTGKPRTYFTHTGKVSVDASNPSTPTKVGAPVASKPAAAASAAPAVDEKTDKKKRRFTMSFGKKG